MAELAAGVPLAKSHGNVVVSAALHVAAQTGSEEGQQACDLRSS